MNKRIEATLCGVHGMGTLVPSGATHNITLVSDRQQMWELLYAVIAELRRDHTFHSRDPKHMDLTIDLFVEMNEHS
jgi:hypothetical protein